MFLLVNGISNFKEKKTTLKKAWVEPATTPQCGVSLSVFQPDGGEGCEALPPFARFHQRALASNNNTASEFAMDAVRCACAEYGRRCERG